MDLWWFSITIFTIIIFVVDIKILFFTKFFTWMSFFSVFIFSIGIYIAYFFIADMIPSFVIFRTVYALITSPIFYFNLYLIIGISILFDMFILITEREIKTPLYLLYKSLLE